MDYGRAANLLRTFPSQDQIRYRSRLAVREMSKDVSRSELREIVRALNPDATGARWSPTRQRRAAKVAEEYFDRAAPSDASFGHAGAAGPTSIAEDLNLHESTTADDLRYSLEFVKRRVVELISRYGGAKKAVHELETGDAVDFLSASFPHVEWSPEQMDRAAYATACWMRRAHPFDRDSSRVSDYAFFSEGMVRTRAPEESVRAALLGGLTWVGEQVDFDLNNLRTQ